MEFLNIGVSGKICRRLSVKCAVPYYGTWLFNSCSSDGMDKA